MTKDFRYLLSEVVRDPVQISTLKRDDIPNLLGALEEIRVQLWGRIFTTEEKPREVPPPPTADRLLSVDEVAERLGVSKRWVYRHAHKFMFRVKLHGTLRFSERGLNKYLQMAERNATWRQR